MNNAEHQTTDVRKMDIRDRLQNAIKCGGLTGQLFKLAVAEIDKLRMEIKFANRQEQDDA